jgi:predicted RNase H-like nuclease (RuvC/YqgF family)
MLKSEIRRMRRLAEGGGEGSDPDAMEEDLYELDDPDKKYSEGSEEEGPADVKQENRKLRRAILNQGRNNRAMGSKLDEYRSAVESLREQLTEMNLFNAKLLYVNKMLQNRDVSSTQRRSIIEALDSARSLREVKLLYKSLTESIEKRKSGRTLNESAIRRNLGSASRTTGRSSVENSESTEINRWAVLAGINNN